MIQNNATEGASSASDCCQWLKVFAGIIIVAILVVVIVEICRRSKRSAAARTSTGSLCGGARQRTSAPFVTELKPAAKVQANPNPMPTPQPEAQGGEDDPSGALAFQLQGGAGHALEESLTGLAPCYSAENEEEKWKAWDSGRLMPGRLAGGAVQTAFADADVDEADADADDATKDYLSAKRKSLEHFDKARPNVRGMLKGGMMMCRDGMPHLEVRPKNVGLNVAAALRPPVQIAVSSKHCGEIAFQDAEARSLTAEMLV